MRLHCHKQAPPRQHGFTLVELMVSILIALFLLAGLMTLVMRSGNTSNVRNQMQQMQDNERVAMTILANVIQQAGYYPDPTNTQVTNVLGVENDSGAGGLNYLPQQAIGGSHSSSAPGGDIIGVRFVAPIADPTGATGEIANSIINCAGGSSGDTTTTHTYSNVFQIATVNGTTYLQCVLTDTPDNGGNPVTQTVNLVPGLYDMQVWYGIAGSGASDANVTQYVTTPSDWTAVTSVKIRLYFQQPQYGFSGGQVNSAATSSAVTSETHYVERVIAVMSRAGVNT